MQVLFGGTFDPVHDGHVMMVDSLVCAFPNATIHGYLTISRCIELA